MASQAERVELLAVVREQHDGVGLLPIRVDSAARCAAASSPAATAFSVTSEYVSACALALLVMAAIQPWSAAGAENPMVTALPGAEFGFAASGPLVWVLFGVCRCSCTPRVARRCRSSRRPQDVAARQHRAP